jgi:predicted hydrocarbon binding protein
MTTRKRTQRRAADRAGKKLVADLERLASLSPGGAPDRPILVTSPSEVEVLARATPCPVCEGELRPLEHTAETIGGARLRVAKTVCAACGRRREIYFQLKQAVAN